MRVCMCLCERANVRWKSNRQCALVQVAKYESLGDYVSVCARAQFAKWNIRMKWKWDTRAQHRESKQKRTHTSNCLSLSPIYRNPVIRNVSEAKYTCSHDKLSLKSIYPTLVHIMPCCCCRCCCCSAIVHFTCVCFCFRYSIWQRESIHRSFLYSTWPTVIIMLTNRTHIHIIPSMSFEYTIANVLGERIV